MAAAEEPRERGAIYPKLKSGRQGMSAEEVAENQRARLRGAMVVAVAEHGYPETTVDEVAALAGVSKRDFYVHFDSKEQCFFAAFDEVIASFMGEVENAAASAEGLRNQVIAGIGTLAELIEHRPESVALVLVDSLAVGPAAGDPRRRSQGIFEGLLRGGFEQAPDGGAVSELETMSIVIGLRRLAYRATRDGTGPELRRAAPALADWVLRYADAEKAAGGEPAQPAPAAEPDDVADPGWEEPPNSPFSRMELSQRERIMRAIAQLACESGYGKLTIPAISARAGTSNQTFYAEFPGKQEAFLTTFETLAGTALAATAEAFAPADDWPRRAGSALATYLSHLASERLFAELAYVQLPAMGRPGLERLDAFMDRLGAIFAQGAPPTAAGRHREVVSAAIVGGIWGTIRLEVMAGRRTDLPALQPQIVEFVAIGFGAG
jgi:AcrR family transcriptional regulator